MRDKGREKLVKAGIMRSEKEEAAYKEGFISAENLYKVPQKKQVSVAWGWRTSKQRENSKMGKVS